MQSKITEAFGNRLRVRPCGILIQNEQVLLIKHTSLGEEGVFWSPPGGGQKFGESIVHCLQREFVEETGLSVKLESFLFVYEYLNLPLHAIELFYRVTPVSGQLKMGADPELGPAHQIIQELKFFSIKALQALPQKQLHPSLHGIKSWKEWLERRP